MVEPTPAPALTTAADRSNAPVVPSVPRQTSIMVGLPGSTGQARDSVMMARKGQLIAHATIRDYGRRSDLKKQPRRRGNGLYGRGGRRIFTYPLVAAGGNGANSPFLFSAGLRLGLGIGHVVFLAIFFGSVLRDAVVLTLISRRVITWSMLFVIINQFEYGLFGLLALSTFRLRLFCSNPGQYFDFIDRALI